MSANGVSAYHWWRACLAQHSSPSGDMPGTYQAPSVGLWRVGSVYVPSGKHLFSLVSSLSWLCHQVSDSLAPDLGGPLVLIAEKEALWPPHRLSGHPTPPPPHISWAGEKTQFKPSRLRTSMLGLWQKPAWIGVGALRFQVTYTSDRKCTSPWMLGVGGEFWVQN